MQRSPITSADHQTGVVPVPDWLGAVLLKARAATAVVDHRSKHLQDLALLLSLPVDVPHWVSQLAGRDRRHLRDAASLLDDAAWRAVSTAVDVRVGHAARALLTGAPSAGR